MSAQPDSDRQRVGSESPFEAVIGFSRALCVGNRVLVAGTAPVWPDGSCTDDPEEQAHRCLAIILQALHEVGAEARDVVRTRMYITNVADADAVARAHGRVFAEILPVATMVVVHALLDARWKVEIEAEAVVRAH